MSCVIAFVLHPLNDTHEVQLRTLPLAVAVMLPHNKLPAIISSWEVGDHANMLIGALLEGGEDGCNHCRWAAGMALWQSFVCSLVQILAASQASSPEAALVNQLPAWQCSTT